MSAWIGHFISVSAWFSPVGRWSFERIRIERTTQAGSIIRRPPLRSLSDVPGSPRVTHRRLRGHGPVQEETEAGLLHHLRPTEAGHLAEALVGVDDCAVLDVVHYKERPICRTNDKRPVRGQTGQGTRLHESCNTRSK